MDQIGEFTFLKTSGMPHRMQGNWEASARAGVNGVSLKFQGISAEPFVMRSMSFSPNFQTGKELFRSYLSATLAGPLALLFGDTLEPFQLYKVLRVTPIHPGGVRAIVRGHRAQDSQVYFAMVEADWVLQPIDTSLQAPQP